MNIMSQLRNVVWHIEPGKEVHSLHLRGFGELTLNHMLSLAKETLYDPYH